MTPLPDAPRILLYTDDPERGGVAQYNHSVLMELVARRHMALCVQTLSKSPLVIAQHAAGVIHEWLPYDTAAEFGRTVVDMEAPRAIFQRHRPDLIIFSDCCPVSNIGARQAALALHIPFVIVVGFAAAYLARQFAPCLPILARHYAAAREVVAVSEENLQLLRSHFGLSTERGRVVHYGRPDVFFTPTDAVLRKKLRMQLAVSEKTVIALTTARLARLKGHHHQLAALHKLLKTGRGENLHLLWVGDGDQRHALEASIRQLGLHSRVTLLGHRWDTADWYDTADFFVLPTDYEGMPLAIMEAMAKSLPVAASAVSGIPEELGPTGRLLPDPALDANATVTALAAIFAEWSEDSALRQHLGKAAQERANELFRESLMLERTLALVEAHLPIPTHP
ncbi:glycosyltransferase family 4 protein [Rariglobus hedericola]|uniref:Glycosyltransferase family 4 protein n=1 Tax=Rariglobus hedericola TaxID=2597822 RepID=A0A556QPL4_9BACT|nr:glycosyltransferase family 4 protein [Rariglobus hedericola]TSJ78575.1 glycosyltransferase family 4 protein [Rariglobus hedericola]